MSHRSKTLLVPPALALMFLLLTGSVPGMVAAAGTGAKTMDGKPPLVIAHRGASGYLPGAFAGRS